MKHCGMKVMMGPGLSEEEHFEEGEEGERRAAHQGMEIKWLRADA